VIEQLENFAQTCGLKVYKTPSEEEATTVNAFLNTDDFFFEVSVSINGKHRTHYATVLNAQLNQMVTVR
jgi:hypothetical protein